MNRFVSAIKKCLLKVSVNVILLTPIGLMGCASHHRLDASELSLINSNDLDIILSWWDGYYNNDSQITALKEDGAPIWQKDVPGQKLGGYLPVTSFYKPVDLPAFGDHVIYVEERTFGKTGNPYRQRIYTLDFDEVKKLATLKLWYFKDREKYLGTWEDTDKLNNLKPSDFSPLPDNCDLVITKTKNRYEMSMPKNQCAFGESMFDYQVSLGKDSFWYRDRIVNPNTGIVISTAGSFGWHKLDKLKP